MSILLTGGAGFIGSACLVRLLSKGKRVVVLDSFEPTLYKRALKEKHLKWARAYGDFDFIEGDIRDEDRLQAVFAKHSISVVLHIAAIAGVRPSISQPDLYVDVNLTGTALLLKVARAHGVEKFVLASSSSVYGGNTKTPFSEADPVDAPISPYAATKRSMELLAKTDHHLHGGDITCLRFFTVYGPRQRPQMAIHKFMRLIAQDKPIPMFGDGTSARDYTYIDDIVSGVMGAIENLDGYRIYNLGGDQVVSLRELIDEISEVVGRKAKIEQLPMPPGDVMITYADIQQASKDLGYKPETSLKSGLRKMWAWYQTVSSN